MSRNRILITYDVTDDKRRTKVHRILRDVGDHVQYSVFVADLNEREYIQVRSKIRERIHHDQDQVLFIDLGPAERDPLDRIESLGRQYLEAERTQII